MVARRLSLAFALLLLPLPAALASPASRADPEQLALPATELGHNWSTIPGSQRRYTIAEAEASRVGYENSADYPSPRRVYQDLQVFPSPAAAEARLTDFRVGEVWRRIAGLGDGTAAYAVGPVSDARRPYAESSYWYRVAHVVARMHVTGRPDLQEVDAQARQLVVLQERWLRQQLGQPARADASAWLTALPTPAARLLLKECERFVADVTIPDGSQVAPGQAFEKVWRVANCGETTWEGYRAERVEGTFGPESFDVPRTPPGAEVDLAVAMQAPPSIGEHVAIYRLLGPGDPFGGFSVVVDVADCGPLPEVSARPGAELGPRSLLLGNTAVPGAWCLVSEEQERRWSVVRYNSAAYGSPRRAQVWASVWPSEAHAEQALLGFPKGALISEDPRGYRPAEGAPWEVDGGRGLHWTWTDRGAGFEGADYVFRVGRVVGWAQASGALGQAPELDSTARTFALAQLAKVRTALGVAAPAAIGAWPSPEAVYSALRNEPFGEDELPAGLPNIAIRARETDDGAGPVGTVTVLARGPDAGDEPDAAITYAIYRSVAEAEAAYKGFTGVAYMFFPRNIPAPARCSATGPLQNECAVLVGNVMIYGDARLVDLGLGHGGSRPAGPTADGMARAGLAHMERVLGGLPWSDAPSPPGPGGS